jgi:hypothetical protein
LWAELHPLQPGETEADLANYSGVANDELIISALKGSLKEVQYMLRVLNMAPSIVAWDKKWFTKPWTIEVMDPKNLACAASQTPKASG